MSRKRDRKAKSSRNALSTPRSFLALVALVVVMAGFIWATLNVAMFLDVGVVALDADNYRPARFTVDAVVYQKYRKSGDRYYAEGRIDDKIAETVNLRGVAPIVHTRDALEKHFGRQPVILDVMYNSNRTYWRINGQSIRVQPAQENFAKRVRSAASWVAMNILASIVVATLALLYLRSAWRKGKRPAGFATLTTTRETAKPLRR